MLEAVATTFLRGGWVTHALVVVSMGLWSMVWLRAKSLGRDVVPRFLAEAARLEGDDQRLGLLAQRATRDLAGLRDVVSTLVAVAPLLGLLGTVVGMVEMFASLHRSGGATGQATVAGGISRALTTTQLGLIIGAPGLVASQLLRRRETARVRQLQEILGILRDNMHEDKQKDEAR